MKQAVILFLLLSCAVFTVRAQEARPLAEDPEIEKRLHNLTQELRCVKCQNETLAESRAPLAVELRELMREQMRAGKTDKEIIAFLTGRYGDFVLYRPPVRPTTYLLWFGPFVLLVVGLVLLFRYLRHRRELIVDHPLSQDERRRVEELLKEPHTKETA